MRFRIVASSLITLALGTQLNAAEYGVLGFTLGMSSQEVIDQLNNADGQVQHRFVQARFNVGPEWVANGIGVIDEDRFVFAFTGPGSGNELYAVSRETSFTRNGRQAPLVQTAVDAAIAHYGEPSFIRKRSDGQSLFWLIREVGEKAVELSEEERSHFLAFSTCSRLPEMLDQVDANEDQCGSIYIYTSVFGRDGVASNVETRVVDYSKVSEAKDADRIWVEKIQQQEQQKKLDAAADVPAPRF